MKEGIKPKDIPETEKLLLKGKIFHAQHAGRVREYEKTRRLAWTVLALIVLLAGLLLTILLRR